MAFETPKTGMSLEETQRYLYRLSEQLNLMYDGLESSLSKVDGNIGYGGDDVLRPLVGKG